jgi:hypothetical protein
MRGGGSKPGRWRCGSWIFFLFVGFPSARRGEEEERVLTAYACVRARVRACVRACVRGIAPSGLRRQLGAGW